MKRTAAAHTYFVCLRPDEPPIRWDIYGRAQINRHTAYFGGVLRAMEGASERSGLTVYLTWDVDALPRYGPDVVALVVGDEWARHPRYAHRVAAVFKCYGTRPALSVRPLAHPSYRHALAAVQYLRARWAGLPGAVVRRRERLRGRPAHVYSIPLGYANQIKLPVKPIDERRFDVSFAGSVVHQPVRPWSPRRWLQTPKALSRRQMTEALECVRRRRPEWSVDVTVTEGYHTIRTADPATYSRRMMDTVVALVPRGTSLETYRYFEALRAGCVVVSEPLPPRWFYDGAPSIRVDDWGDLENVLDELLGDRQRIHDLHRKSLDWWREVCSEQAVGRFIARTLDAILRHDAPVRDAPAGDR